MYFRKYGLQKKYLNKFLKNPISKDTSASGMLNRKKHCSNLDETIFGIVIDHPQGSWVRRNLSI